MAFSMLFGRRIGLDLDVSLRSLSIGVICLIGAEICVGAEPQKLLGLQSQIVNEISSFVMFNLRLGLGKLVHALCGQGSTQQWGTAGQKSDSGHTDLLSSKSRPEWPKY